MTIYVFSFSFLLIVLLVVEPLFFKFSKVCYLNRASFIRFAYFSISYAAYGPVYVLGAGYPIVG
jgi:hypothetical protein